MYTVTIKLDGNNETFHSVDAANLKRMRKTYGTNNVKATKNESPKFWYYRGVQVAIIEEVTNGYTLVNAVDGSFYFRHAITAELEYR